MVDAADTASKGMAAAFVMRTEPYLQSSGLPREIQSTIENLIFDCSFFFKDLRPTLHSLVIYALAPKRKHHKRVQNKTTPSPVLSSVLSQTALQMSEGTETR